MRHGGHFWYDGHHGHVECVGRERWKSYLNGEQFDTGSHPGHMKDELLSEMKYRVERDPDFPVVCYGVLRYIHDHVPGRNGENDWVLFDAIQGEVILNDHGLALEAMHALEHDGHIGVTKARDLPNYQYLLAPTEKDLPEPEDLRGSLTNIWNEYE